MTDKQAQMEDLRSALPNNMEAKMKASQEKYGDSWMETDPEYLWRRVEEELLELRQAVEHHQDTQRAFDELVDLNNFLIMYLIQEEEQ